MPVVPDKEKVVFVIVGPFIGSLKSACTTVSELIIRPPSIG